LKKYIPREPFFFQFRAWNSGSTRATAVLD
jgi:hypothetical protein